MRVRRLPGACTGRCRSGRGCPTSWQAIHFRLRWRGSRLRVTVDQAGITFDLDGDPTTVLVHGRPVELAAGTTTVPHEAVPVG